MTRPDIALTRYFADLPDPRIDRTKKHLLGDILVITVCAVICGADTFEEVERFGRRKRHDPFHPTRESRRLARISSPSDCNSLMFFGTLEGATPKGPARVVGIAWCEHGKCESGRQPLTDLPAKDHRRREAGAGPEPAQGGLHPH